MKKRYYFLLSLPLIFGFIIPKGDCGSLLFFKQGTSITLTSYSADDKIIGSSKTVYNKINQTASGTEVEATQESFDKKGKSQSKSNFNLKCSDGTLFFDMKMMLDQKQAEAYKDFEVQVEGVDKEIPSNMIVGTTLKDANIKFSFKTKDGTSLPMMNMDIKVFNRKIESIESITTPAGTWECYKLTEDIEIKSIIKLKASSVTWFSYQAGTVKTESYSDKGKLTGKSILTELIVGK
jgi:hypothetical protein